MSKYSVALLGAGQIGSRHLQSIAAMGMDLDIYVYDVSPASLLQARDRVTEIDPNIGLNSIKYVDKIQHLPSQIDLCIIATSADVRCAVFCKLIKYAEIKSVVFEKVLFQRQLEYEIVAKELRERGIDGYVNHPFRMYPFYIRLFEELQNSEIINVTIEGGSWGLACNSLHYLDLIRYLRNDVAKLTMNTRGLTGVHDSKRVGFYEITGRLSGNIGSTGFAFIDGGLSEPVVVKIQTDEKVIEYEESEIICYQSQLSSRFVSQLLLGKKCEIPDYGSVFDMHKSFVGEIEDYIRHESDFNSSRCPIT